MTDITNMNWVAMSDSAIAETIGTFIKHHRLEQNKTQSQLSSESGINRSTLVQFENGKGGNLITLVQLLRALNLLHVFEHFQVKQELSPIQLAKMDEEKRKRASRKTMVKQKPKSNW